MRERFGAALQVIGLVLMPLAFIQGFRDELSFGDEIVVAFAGFLLIVIGRGLRGGASAK